jgi:Lrp/AsnC family transcriptional regulator
MEFTDPERMLLREIQRDSALSLAELSTRCGMAQSTVWRKLQEFEAAGLIRARVALLDPAKVGAKLCVLASIRLHDHSEEAVAGFTRMVGHHPEILECHSVSGTADYILKVRVADVEAYEAFMSLNLLRSPYVRSVVSSFVLKEIKATTALPL